MNTSKSTIPILAGIAIGAAGVGYFAWSSAQPKPVRDPVVHPALSDPPTVRQVTTPHGTLLEMRVPTDAAGLGLVELQTCYIWRDAQSLSASISCPAPPTVAISEN